MTGYTLALATVIPITGWAADRFGTKRLWMGSILAFTLGSLLCAMAPNILLLILFRVLQGIGGGMLMPLGFMILTRVAGPKRLGRLMAALGIPMLLGPIGGPILGGWLIGASAGPGSSWLTSRSGWARSPRGDRVPHGPAGTVGDLRHHRGAAAVPRPGDRSCSGCRPSRAVARGRSRRVGAPAIIGLALIVAFACACLVPRGPPAHRPAVCSRTLWSHKPI